MALQKVFTPSYTQFLKNNIQVENYQKESFSYDASQTRSLSGVIHQEDLLQRLDPSASGDYTTAIAIYEAFEKISPVFAQQDDLWTYLAHVDLFEYVKERWEIPSEGTKEEKINHIEHHWFRDKFQFSRTTFAGFWWNVHLTISPELEDKYELTKYLFKNTEFRTSSFGEQPLIRYEGSMKGILRFVRDNESIFSTGFNAKARYIRHLFNILGGYKNIASLPREYFYSVLDKRKDTIKDIHDAKAVKAGASIYND